MNQIVAEFDDHTCLLLFDADEDERSNAEFAAAVACEGRRRVKAGKSDAIRVRERRENDQFIQSRNNQ